MERRNAWVVALCTFLATLAVNGLLFAYGYGKLDARVENLEEQRTELRAELVAARARIEAAIKELKEQPRR